MTVQELRAALNNLPDNAEIFIIEDSNVKGVSKVNVGQVVIAEGQEFYSYIHFPPDVIPMRWAVSIVMSNSEIRGVLYE